MFYYQTQGNQIVTIVVYDPTIDGSMPSTTTIMSVDGGHGTHQFQIKCNSIPTEGVNKNVVHVFRGKYVPCYLYSFSHKIFINF